MSNNSYRPSSLKDMIGFSNIKELISISLQASIERNVSFPHTLINGAPGLGKSNLANVIAKERGSAFKVYLSNVFRKREDIQNLMAGLDSSGYDDDGNIIGKINPTIIFLDEIHQLTVAVQESLFQAMEENLLTIIRKHPVTKKIERSISWVPLFTLIGATTRAGKLDKAFIDRFKLNFNLVPYTDEEILLILKNYCAATDIRSDEPSLVNIAKRSRGVARIAINFLERVRDCAISSKSEIITDEIVEKTFNLLAVDGNGLDSLDVAVLNYLYKAYPNKVGLGRLAGAVSIPEEVLLEIIEPYLLRQGFVYTTPSGRIISEKGMEYCLRNLATLSHSNKGLKESIVEQAIPMATPRRLTMA